MARSALKNIYRLIEEAQSDVSVQDAFLRDLTRSIELTDSKKTRLPSKTYKPSSMQCIRNMYYQRVGEAVDDGGANACLIGICESGTDRHTRVQNAISQMKDNGIECEYIDVGKYVQSRNLQNLQIVAQQGNETKLFDVNNNISFLCDGIIRYRGHYYILEIKTESVYKWTKRTNVDPAHEHQGTCYSMLLEIPEVLFLYINRDNCAMKSYLYTPTDRDKSELLKMIQECETHVSNKTVPSKSDNLPRKVCDYCNYKVRCLQDG